MMEISDAIDILHDLADELNGLIDESCICFEPQEDQVEAIYLATRILSALDANKAKAENIVQAVRICYAPGPLEKCQKCPYYDDDCQSYGSKQDKDIVDLLMQVYSQGGDGK